MDRKTLEYMEERAKKAREIVDRIEKLLGQVNRIKRSRGVMDLYTPTNTVRIEINRNDDRAQNNYTTKVAAAIYNTFINVTLAEIRHLEQELSEL